MGNNVANISGDGGDGAAQVELETRRSFPVYWKGEDRRVLRGQWFARTHSSHWLPLREDVADQLEVAYQRRVRLHPRPNPSPCCC